MPTHLASLDSLVHPHQIEVQEFDSYGLVIDARSTEAYQEDHIPGAVSVPVTSQRLQASNAEGTTLVASDVEPPVPYALAGHLCDLRAGASVLVYCDRGGLDSLVWADPLKALGYRVDVLGGGWGNYRRWVDAGLEVLPRALTFRWLLAQPISGLCLVLDQLAAFGEQVLDVPRIAGQQLVPGLTMDGDELPSQAAFETALLFTLRRFDPRRPVWIRDSTSGFGKLSLPGSMCDAMQRSTCLWVDVPLTSRATVWSDRLMATGIDLHRLLGRISCSPLPPSAALQEHWRSLVDAGRRLEALTEVLSGYIDARNHFTSPCLNARVVSLPSLTLNVVSAEVERWCRHEDMDGSTASGSG